MDNTDTSQSSTNQQLTNPNTDTTPVPDLSALMDSPNISSASSETPLSDTTTQMTLNNSLPDSPIPPTKKKFPRRILIALLLLLIISLPVIATLVYQTQQKNQIADLRTRAISPGDSCTPDNNPVPVCDAGTQYSCIVGPYGSTWQISGTCSLTPTGQQCIALGDGCANQGGTITCCNPGVCMLAVPAQGIWRCGLPNSCKPSGNSASACDGHSNGDDVGPCVCRFSSLGGNDCACIAAGTATPLPSPTNPPSPTSPPNNPTSPPNNPTNTPRPTATRTPTPGPGTPTSTPVIGQCQNIKLYREDGTTLVGDPNNLKKGDTIIIAVIGTNATQARMRINGAATWTETTNTNSAGEWVFPTYTIPSTGTLTFTIEAELFIAGVWQ